MVSFKLDVKHFFRQENLAQECYLYPARFDTIVYPWMRLSQKNNHEQYAETLPLQLN
jgi:hypothetical protein